MNELNIDDLRGQDFDIYKGKSVTVMGFVCNKGKTEIFAKEIIFECPECSNKMRMQQTSDVIQKPKQCSCGRRGYFPIREIIKIDMGTFYITNPFSDTPRKIKVVVSGDGVTPLIWNEIRVGKKILVEGLLDLDLDKKHLKPYLRTEKVEIKGELSEEDKMNIIEKYVTNNFSITLDNLYQDMSDRCLIYPDIMSILEQLHRLRKIAYLPQLKQFIVLTKFDTNQIENNKQDKSKN